YGSWPEPFRVGCIISFPAAAQNRMPQFFLPICKSSPITSTQTCLMYQPQGVLAMKRFLKFSLMFALPAVCAFLPTARADDKKADGWVAVFNGKDLDGWKIGYGGKGNK